MNTGFATVNLHCHTRLEAEAEAAAAAATATAAAAALKVMEGLGAVAAHVEEDYGSSAASLSRQSPLPPVGLCRREASASTLTRFSSSA